MSDKRIANYSSQEDVPQPRRIIVTRDPITREFKHEYAPLENSHQEISPFTDQPYTSYEPMTPVDNQLSVPERSSKKRLRRQRIGHSVLLAATLGGMYVAGDYVATSFNGGRTPNYIEDVAQIPADLGNTYHSVMAAFGVAQSVSEKIDDIKRIIPENGDK